MVTLKQLAKELSLSPQAVSAALAGRSGTSKVGPKTLERVQALALKLNYRTHFSAKTMRSKHLKQIGLVLPKYEIQAGSAATFSIALLTLLGLNEAIIGREWQLQILQDDGIRSKVQKLPQYLREQSVDAVIVAGTGTERDRTIEEDLIRFSIPYVFLNEEKERNCICVDDEKGAALATQHLLDLGHQRIHFVGTGAPHYSQKARLHGYGETMKGAKESPVFHNLLLYLPKIKEYQNRLKIYRKNVKEFVSRVMSKNPPTALFCSDDMLALLVSSALQAAGYDVPNDVSLVGYNDFPYVGFHYPPLTTVRVNFDQMGEAAGKMILDLVKAPQNNFLPIRISPEMIVRESTQAIQ
ncbi:MAG: LacI family DNA-binding transcriptional regulator [Verrucomicrobiota bacterium]